MAALVAMFVIPYLPNWLLEGPRTIRHRPRRHVCADCGVPWTPRHACAADREPACQLLSGHQVPGIARLKTGCVEVYQGHPDPGGPHGWQGSLR